MLTKQSRIRLCVAMGYYPPSAIGWFLHWSFQPNCAKGAGAQHPSHFLHRGWRPRLGGSTELESTELDLWLRTRHFKMIGCGHKWKFMCTFICFGCCEALPASCTFVCHFWLKTSGVSWWRYSSYPPTIPRSPSPGVSSQLCEGCRSNAPFALFPSRLATSVGGEH